MPSSTKTSYIDTQWKGRISGASLYILRTSEVPSTSQGWSGLSFLLFLPLGGKEAVYFEMYVSASERGQNQPLATESLHPQDQQSSSSANLHLSVLTLRDMLEQGVHCSGPFSVLSLRNDSGFVQLFKRSGTCLTNTHE